MTSKNVVAKNFLRMFLLAEGDFCGSSSFIVVGRCFAVGCGDSLYEGQLCVIGSLCSTQ